MIDERLKYMINILTTTRKSLKQIWAYLIHACQEYVGEFFFQIVSNYFFKYVQVYHRSLKCVIFRNTWNFGTTQADST